MNAGTPNTEVSSGTQETADRPASPPSCSCLHRDARECARIRDGEAYAHFFRLCECACHKEIDRFEDDDD